MHSRYSLHELRKGPGHSLGTADRIPALETDPIWIKPRQSMLLIVMENPQIKIGFPSSRPPAGEGKV